MVAAIGGAAAGIVIMAFLGKPLLKQLFEKELAEHQAKLDVQAKAKYEIESRNHDREIERFKAQLEIAAHEWQTVFDALEEQVVIVGFGSGA